MKNLSRQGLKPQYIAVREQSTEKHQHYHVALLLDGQKTQSIYNHIKTAERLWDNALGLEPREGGYGLIDDCTTSRTGETQINGVMLRPDDPDMEKKKEDCFRRASYLAKTNTKGNAPKYQREMFSSRIPKQTIWYCTAFKYSPLNNTFKWTLFQSAANWLEQGRVTFILRGHFAEYHHS